jgi:hypothetical protein
VSDYVRKTVLVLSFVNENQNEDEPYLSMQLQQSRDSWIFVLEQLQAALYLLLMVQKGDLEVVLTQGEREGKMYHRDPRHHAIQLAPEYTFPPVVELG